MSKTIKCNVIKDKQISMKDVQFNVDVVKKMKEEDFVKLYTGKINGDLKKLYKEVVK